MKARIQTGVDRSWEEYVDKERKALRQFDEVCSLLDENFWFDVL